MHVGIFGGTFDPPHVGHLIVAEWLRDRFDLDEVIWMPAAQSPHKTERTPAPADVRLRMVHAATEGNPAFSVSDIELRRGGVSYTIDTLRELTASRPEDRFSLIMGSDSLTTFPRWRMPEAIIEMADLIVYTRPGDEAPTVPEWLERNVHVTDAPLLEISATVIRQRCAVGQSIRYLVPASVEALIEEHALYR